MNMNLSMIQILGAAALLVGVFLLIFAYTASSAPIEELSNTLTGRYTDQTRYLLLGIAATVVGGVLVFSRRQPLARLWAIGKRKPTERPSRPRASFRMLSAA